MTLDKVASKAECLALQDFNLKRAALFRTWINFRLVQIGVELQTRSSFLITHGRQSQRYTRLWEVATETRILQPLAVLDSLSKFRPLL
jgi:hypothetical protein